MVLNGVAVYWGIPGFTIVESTFGTMLPQSFDHTKRDSKDSIKNTAGKTVTTIWPDPMDEITLEAFIKGTGLADAKAQVKLPPAGTLCTVSFTSTDYVAVSTGLVWELQEGAKISGTNTSAIKISLPLIYNSSITTGAPA